MYLFTLVEARQLQYSIQNMSKIHHPVKSERIYKIPLDTLGHPLPPPVRPEHICRIPQKDWGNWWTRFHNDTLENELDCSVCGLHFPEPSLLPLEREIIDSTIQKRVLNTTATKVRICRGCKAACGMCGRTIISEQKKKFNGICQACIEEERITQKKRKAPSRR